MTYLDGSGSDVAVVGKSSREGRAIVERVRLLALGSPHLLLEGVDVLPVLENRLLLLGEVRSVGNCLNECLGTYLG